MKSTDGSVKSNQKEGGEKTSLHEVELGDESPTRLKKTSSFQKEAMSPDRKKAPESPLKKQLQAD